MCILATALKGAEFSTEVLQAMFYANDDGAGWAYAKDGKIYYSKGYTNVNKFVKAVQKLPKDVERMVHCRIATHGGVTKPLTHPFPITRDYAKMEMLSGVLSSGYILGHNGILSNFIPTDKSHSDTEELVRCLANVKTDIMSEEYRDIIDILIKGSRVAILNTNGEIKRYGTGWTYDNGIYFSNTTWKYYKYKYACDYEDDWGGYYNNYSRYYDEKYTYPTTPRTPNRTELVDVLAGEVIKMPISKRAYINATDGSYLVDRKTKKLYGAYKDTIWSTDHQVCDCVNCDRCTYNCPMREEDACL